MAKVIRLWLNDNGRWNSPKYLGGESYGTTRTAMVARELEGGTFNDVGLNGLILISTILDFAGREPTPGNEMAYVVTLPNMAAAAYYHGKVQAPSVEAIVEEARQFAIGPFITALLKGQDLPDAERAAVRAEMARLTGLSERYLDQADLRVTSQRFYKELLRDRGLTIGRLDARYTGRDFDNAGEYPDNDPSFYGIDAGYTAAINSWARETLGFETPANTSRSGASRAATGSGPPARAAVPISTLRPISDRRCGRTRSCACSMRRGITILPRPSSARNIRSTAWASRRTVWSCIITMRAT